MTATFRLFVAGETARSLRAAAQLRKLADSTFSGDYEIVVIDVLDQPDLADEDRVLATPMVIKLSPAPRRRVVGDLADLERVAMALEIYMSQDIAEGAE